MFKMPLRLSTAHQVFWHNQWDLSW